VYEEGRDRNGFLGSGGIPGPLLDLEPGVTKAVDVEQTINGHILTQGQLIGKYGR
jgi:hypothetical protein